ncbi:zinc finger, CCHC-type containing protein [Tanacetum coccineum]
MTGAAMKHMGLNFSKLDKFKGVDFRVNVESSKELWDSLEAKYLVEDASSKKFLVINFTNYKITDSRPVLKQYNELLDFKYTLKHLEEELTLVELGGHLRIEESLKMQDSDKPKGNNVADPSVVNMVEHNNFSRYNDNKGGKVGNKANGSGTNGSVDGYTNSLKGWDVAWWVDSGAIVHVCKDRYLFKTYESLNNGSILHMINESTALEEFGLNIGNDNITSAFMSTSKLNDLILWHARLGHVHFKRMQHMSKDELILPFDMDTVKAVVRLHDSKLKTLGKRGIECIFVGYVEHSKAFRFYVIEPNDSVSINSIIESKDAIFNENKFSSVPKPSLRIPNETEDIGGSVVPEEVTEEEQGMRRQINDEIDSIMGNKTWVLADLPPVANLIAASGSLKKTGRAVVRLPDPKLKTLGERGIKCIFVGYAEHSKAFRFYVIEPNESVSINSIIESRDVIFDENRFSLVLRPSLRIPNGTEDIGGSVVLKEVTEEDAAFWKEAINDEMDSIMGNNTWVLTDLPPGFKQKSRIDYFDTYAPVARISTIRLLINMTSIHNLIIHQMDVKTTFLNGDLEEEVYMNQPQGFIMPGNENKVNLTKEFLSLKFSMKYMGEADVILGIKIKHESNGIAISQSHYIEKDVRQRGNGGQKGSGSQKGKIINMVRCQWEDQKIKSMLVDEEWMNVPITFPPAAAGDLSDEALVVEFPTLRGIATLVTQTTTIYECRSCQEQDREGNDSRHYGNVRQPLPDQYEAKSQKCSFGVEEGKFLGYMVTSEGIRANPAKTKDIVEMHSPKTWAQMQSFSRKLAALNCFLPRSAEKSLLPLKH